MAKNKGKRNRPQRNTASSTTLAGVGSVVNQTDAEGDESELEAPEAATTQRPAAIAVEPTPSTDNVIPFPRSPAVGEEVREAKITLISGSGSFGLAVSDSAVEGEKSEAPAKSAEPRVFEPAAGEHEGTAVSPDGATGDQAKVVASESPAIAVEKAAQRTTDKPPRMPDEEARKTMRGEIVGKKDDSRRLHKESLSTHLSDEAKAFFSDAAAVAAYKQTHDTFEDLSPASEDHVKELARSKRAMAITGALLIGVIAVVAGFGIYSRTSVPETGLMQRPATTEPAVTNPAPAAEPTTPPVAEATAPPAAEPTPVAAADASVAVTVPSGPTPPAAAPPVEAAPVPLPPPGVAAPSAQTPQQLLAAARGFRGPFAGKLAAYNAYFDANPADDRAMTTYAMSLAESAHHAEAEAVANRAVTANPRNGQAWFVLAYARSEQHNRVGAAEARTHCLAIGGTWATECRAIH